MKRWADIALAAAIFLLNVALNGPLFLPGELPFRGSIEGGYVGMARFVAAHPNPWGWNPFPYCGLPTQFLYVPALPYVTAMGMHLLPHVSPDNIYRTIVSVMACFGPVTLFWFALYFTGSRWWALTAALLYTFVSPSYAMFPAVEKDRGFVQLPWRIQLLAKYGEGPHNTGLALLPVALISVWRAVKSRGYPRLLAAAVILAAIPLINWVAALALGIAALLFLLAGYGETEFRAWRALAAAALAWLLACFWLTFSFVRIIAFNWPADSFGYHLRRRQGWLLAGVVLGALAIRAVFRWRRGSFYFCFVTLAAFVFGWIATAFYVFGADTLPESRRYALEFEFFAALALVEGVRLLIRRSNPTLRMCVAAGAIVLFVIGAPGSLGPAPASQVWKYATQGWKPWMPVPKETTVEYGLAQWIAQHPPEGRVFASGGLRFRLNSWLDAEQVGGSFETGLRNRVPVDLAYRIRTGGKPDPNLLDLQAMGTEYVVVHDAKSREYYRDFLRPERLAGLPVLYHVEADTIYGLPRRPLAHLVRADEFPDKDFREHPQVLERYVAAIADAARPALRVAWADTSALDVTGPVRPGDLVSVQVNADPGWRAAQDGRAIAIDRDSLGFIVLHAAPAAGTHLELRYRGTAEQRFMAAVCGMAWITALAVLLRIKHFA